MLESNVIFSRFGKLVCISSLLLVGILPTSVADVSLLQRSILKSEALTKDVATSSKHSGDARLIGRRRRRRSEITQSSSVRRRRRRSSSRRRQTSRRRRRQTKTTPRRRQTKITSRRRSSSRRRRRTRQKILRNFPYKGPPQPTGPFCHAAIWDGDNDVEMADYEPSDCAEWGESCWGAGGHIGEYMKHPQLEEALDKGLKFFHYMDFDQGKKIPDENGKFEKFADTRELEQVGLRRFKTLTKLGEYNIVSKKDFQDLSTRAVKRCRDSKAVNWILQYFDHGMGYEGMFEDRHPAGGPISLIDWTSALGEALEGGGPSGDIGLMLTECSMQRMENIAAIAQLKPSGGAFVRFVSGSEKIMWGSIAMTDTEWLDPKGSGWSTLGATLASQGDDYLQSTPGGTFSVIEVPRFPAFYAALVKLLDALKPMGSRLKAVAKAAASNARAVFEGGRYGGGPFDIGRWLYFLQRNAGSHAKQEFADVFEAYRLMVYWVDKRETSTGLAAEWTTSYAYRKVVDHIGLQKWSRFVKWCEEWIPSYKRGGPPPIRAKGVVAKALAHGGMTFRATYFGKPGVTTAVLAGNLTKLQAMIEFGEKGQTYVSALWRNATVIAVDGQGVFSVQEHIPGMYSIPCWYKPKENRTKYEGEATIREAGLEIQLNRSSGHVIKSHLWAHRDPIDSRPGTPLVTEEVPPSAGGFLVLATKAPQSLSMIRGRLRAPLESDWKARLRNGIQGWADSSKSYRDRIKEGLTAAGHTAEKASLVLPWDAKLLQKLESQKGSPTVQVWLKGMQGKPVLSETTWGDLSVSMD